MLPRLGEFFIQPVAVVELPQDQLQVTRTSQSAVRATTGTAAGNKNQPISCSSYRRIS
jgi:hypothetical protein